MTETQLQNLRKAIELLNEADSLVQAALGASEECYELHNQIENIADEIADIADATSEA